MSDNNKTDSPQSKFGTDGTNVRRASRARNRTVLLTPEATEEMRSQLGGSGLKSDSSKGFGGGFGRTSSGSVEPSSRPSNVGSESNSGTQTFFRPTQQSNNNRQADFGSRKTEQINPEDFLPGPADDRLDFNDSASEADSRPVFSAPSFDAPEISSESTVSESFPSTVEEPAFQPVNPAPKRDSSLDEINRRLKNLSGEETPKEPEAPRPVFSRPTAPQEMSGPSIGQMQDDSEPVAATFVPRTPVVPPSAPQTRPVVPPQVSVPVAEQAKAVSVAPVFAAPTRSSVSSTNLNKPLETPEELDDFSDDFAAFEPVAWEEPAAAQSAGPAAIPPRPQVEISAPVVENVVSDELDEILAVNQETEIIEEQEDMVAMDQSGQDIIWQKQTPLVGFLISLNEENYGKYYELHAGRLVITSEPVAGGSYLLLKNESVSPMHAVLRIAMNGTLQILDQLSESGTKVLRYDTGQEVELSGDKTALNHGDVIQVGDCLFSVCLISIRDQEG